MLHRHASVRIPTKRVEHTPIIHTAAASKPGFMMANGFATLPRTVYVVFIIGIALTLLNIMQLYSVQKKRAVKDDFSEQAITGSNDNNQGRIAWVYGEKMKSGYLSSVVTVLERIGYKVNAGKRLNESSFDVLWIHEYPFTAKKFEPYLTNLKAYEKINHIPGSGYYTSKVNLATADITEGIPKAFQLPDRKDEFLRYANEHPDILWVKKSNEHRGITVQKLTELHFDDSEHFVQQYISNPLLIDGRKFDIGIYTVITSVSPLRVYVYDGDVLLRFCNQNYNPFDPKVPASYVVGDDYTPAWEMPSLKQYYVEQQLTFRETFNAFISSLDVDPELIWDAIKDTIAEANMSPNLSAAHFPENRLLYEQVLYNLFALVGIANYLHGNSLETNSKDKKIREMEVSNRDIVISSKDCVEICADKEQCKKRIKCQLCSSCLSYAHKIVLKAAYDEHMSKRMFRRVLPATKHKPKHVNKMYSEADRILILWFDRKCQKDKFWCQ